MADLEVGKTIEMKGSGAKPYLIKNCGEGGWSCTCPAWRNQSIDPRMRDKLNTKADVLSGGEQQMVAIARALSGNVKLLLLDEPFEGLSPAVVEEVFRSLDQLRAEMTIFVIEHDLDLVLALADHAYVLDRGRVSYTGSAGPLLTDLALRKKVLWYSAGG